MTQELPDILKQLTEKLKNAPSEFRKGNASVVQFYALLNLLHTQGFLCKVDFAPVLQNWPTNLVHLKQLIKFTEQAFTLRETTPEMLQPLKQLEELCSDDRYRYLSEARLLKHEARRWLNYVELLREGTLRSAQIKLILSPDLNLAKKEEEETSTSGRYVKLPVILLNEGGMPAEEVELFIEHENASIIRITTMHDPASSIEKLHDGNYRVKWPFVVDAGQSEIVFIELNYFQGSRIKFRTEFIDYLWRAKKQSHKYVSDFLEINLPIPEHTKFSGFHNPYIHDFPLASAEDWNELMKGHQRDLVNEIIKTLDKKRDRGYVYFIRGLKRIGKSSVLYQLRRQLKENASHIPVYVDFYLWRHNVQNHTKDKIISGQELFYELAVAAAKEVNSPKEIKDENKSANTFLESLRDYQEELKVLSMKYYEFSEFLKYLSQGSEKHVVFLFDELDSWLKVKEFAEDAKNLLQHIISLAKTGACSAIFTYEWANEHLINRFVDEKVLQTNCKPAKFLEKNEIIELFNLSRLPCTEMALEFVWRFTGGWPGLVQVLFHRLFEELKPYGDRKILVDVGMMKDVANNILTSSDHRAFIKFLLRGFDRIETEVLGLLIQTKAIQAQSTQIKNIQRLRDKSFKIDKWLLERSDISDHEASGAFERLLAKQIIEPIFNEEKMKDHTGREYEFFRLRVGFLSNNRLLKLYSNAKRRRRDKRQDVLLINSVESSAPDITNA